MGYVEDSLLEGETIFHRAHTHPIILAEPITVLLTGVIVLIAAAAGRSDAAVVLGGFLIAAGLLYAFQRLFEVITSEFVITDRRVLARKGLISRNTTELHLTKIEGVRVDQGIFARIICYGKVTVMGTGGTKHSFRSIANPIKFRKYVVAQVAKT